MKLPTIVPKSTIQSGMRVDPRDYLYVGRAKAGIGRTIASEANAWTEFMYGIKERDDRQDAKVANRRYAEEMSMFESSHADRSFFSASDLDPEMLSRLEIPPTITEVDEYGNKTSRPNDRIPRYKVYPELQKRHMEFTAEAVSNGISDKHNSKAWLEDTREMNAKEYERAVVLAGAQGIQFILNEEATLVTSYINQKKYEQAITVVEQSEHSTDEYKKAKVQELYTLREKSILENIEKFGDNGRFDLARQEVGRLKQANTRQKGLLMTNIGQKEEIHGYYKTISMPAETTDQKRMKTLELEKSMAIVAPYNDEYNGLLGSKQRMEMYIKLRREARNLKTALDAARNVDFSLLKQEVNLTADSVLKGMRLDPNQISDATASNEILLSQGKITEADAVKNSVILSSGMQESINEIYKGTRDFRRQEEAGLKKYPAKGIAMLHRDVILDVINRATTEFDKNIIQYYDNHIAQIAPIDIAADADSLASQFAVRKRQVLEIADTFEEPANGFFNEDELRNIRNMLSEPGVNYGEKLKVFKAMATGIESKRMIGVAMKQLGADGSVPKVYMASGNLMADGFEDLARMNLRGSEIRQVDKNFNDTVLKDNFRTEFKDTIKNLYVMDKEYEEQVFQSAINIYATKISDSGEDTSEYNGDVFKVAVKNAISNRNLFKYGGSTLFLPPNMTEGHATQWLDYMLPKDIKGKFEKGVDASDVLTKIQNGNLKLISKSDDNEYIIYDDSKNRVVRNSNGTPFVLSIGTSVLEAFHPLSVSQERELKRATIQSALSP